MGLHRRHKKAQAAFLNQPVTPRNTTMPCQGGRGGKEKRIMKRQAMFKRGVSAALACVMLCGLMFTQAFAADVTWSGSGTEADPYQIANAED